MILDVSDLNLLSVLNLTAKIFQELTLCDLDNRWHCHVVIQHIIWLLLLLTASWHRSWVSALWVRIDWKAIASILGVVYRLIWLTSSAIEFIFSAIIALATLILLVKIMRCLISSSASSLIYIPSSIRYALIAYILRLPWLIIVGSIDIFLLISGLSTNRSGVWWGLKVILSNWGLISLCLLLLICYQLLERVLSE